MHNEDLEARLAILQDARDHRRAAELLVHGYGPEIRRFLGAWIPDAADEAFSTFSLDVVLGIHKFERRSSFRTWSYEVARNAGYRTLRGDRRRGARFRPGGTDAAGERPFQQRTETAAYLRTEFKNALRAAVASLDDEDRELFTLRADCRMKLEDIAAIYQVRPATLRQRWHRLEARLRKQVRPAGASNVPQP